MYPRSGDWQGHADLSFCLSCCNPKSSNVPVLPSVAQFPARLSPGTLDDEHVSVKILEHGFRNAPRRLIDGSLNEFNAAPRCQLIKLAAILDFEDPACFLADASFIIANRVLRRIEPDLGLFGALRT